MISTRILLYIHIIKKRAANKHSALILFSRSIIYWHIAAVIALCISGCASFATVKQSTTATIAAAHGMTRQITLGTHFNHVIYTHGDWATASALHIYLEGDGLPWISRDRIAADPTARYPLALHLMAQDPHPALYIGRPCYDGFAQARGCTPWLWTHGRYSSEVVASLVSAIKRVLPHNPERRLTLIGYSGGGVLAVLIARELAGVKTVITLAANLDLDAWTDQHGYSRLVGSINPATLTPLHSAIRQIHLFGKRDVNVTPLLVRRFLAQNPQAMHRLIAGFDHRCCWVEHWPTLLTFAD